MTSRDSVPPWERAHAPTRAIVGRHRRLDGARRRVVAFDPGLAKFGLTAVDTNGVDHVGVGAEVFQTETHATKYQVAQMPDLHRRAAELDRWLGGRLDYFAPHVVAAEEMSWPRDMHAAVMLALAWGVITSQLEARRIPIVCARPSEWRDALVGKDTRPRPKGEKARRARAADRERRSHAVAANTVPELGRVIATTISKALREHAYDSLGVFCWSLNTNLVRGVIYG